MKSYLPGFPALHIAGCLPVVYPLDDSLNLESGTAHGLHVCREPGLVFTAPSFIGSLRSLRNLPLLTPISPILAGI